VAHIGDLGDFRLYRNGALVVGAAGQTRETFFAEQDGKGVDADGMTSGSEFALHVIDGEIAFAHGYGQITNAVAGGRRLRTAMRQAEEGSAFLGIVPELIAEHAEGAWRVPEAASDVAGGLVIDEEGTEGLVLALQGELRGEEEVLVSRRRYLIRSAGLHKQIMLPKHEAVNLF
jgi:hypothetical protein